MSIFLYWGCRRCSVSETENNPPYLNFVQGFSSSSSPGFSGRCLSSIMHLWLRCTAMFCPQTKPVNASLVFTLYYVCVTRNLDSSENLLHFQFTIVSGKSCLKVYTIRPLPYRVWSTMYICSLLKRSRRGHVTTTRPASFSDAAP